MWKEKKSSTEHVILQLTDDPHKNFNENKFTVGVFIYLSKEFGTVDHKIILEKFNYFTDITINGLQAI